MSLVPQFGFFELLMIAVIALIVVGPNDLPKLMRSAGRMAAKARGLAREFSSAFEQMARETEMEELRTEIENLKRDNPVSAAKRELDDVMKPIDKQLRDEADEIKREVDGGPSGTGAVPSTTDLADDTPSTTPASDPGPSANEAAKS